MKVMFENDINADVDRYDAAQLRQSHHVRLASASAMAAALSAAHFLSGEATEASRDAAYLGLKSTLYSLLDDAFSTGLVIGEDIGCGDLRRFSWPSERLVSLSLLASEGTSVGDFVFADPKVQAEFISRAVIFVSQFADLAVPAGSAPDSGSFPSSTDAGATAATLFGRVAP